MTYADLTKWENFLRNYEKKFVHTAMKIGSALKIEANPEEVRSFFILVYNMTFFSKDRDMSGCVEFVRRAKKKGIDLKFILAKSFMLFLSDFSKQAFYSEPSFEVLEEVFHRIEETLRACDVSEEEKEVRIERLVRRLISHREKPVDFSKVDPDSEENRAFIKLFEELKKKGENVELFNIYKGLHVRYEAKILNVREKEVSLEVHPNQLGVIAIDRYSLIKHPSFGSRNVLGEVKSIEPDSRKVKFWRFMWGEQKEDKRRFVRVKPKDITPVELKAEGGINLKGYLIDISIVSLNVFIPMRELPLKEGMEVKIRLKLENCKDGSEMLVETPARVYTFRDLPEGRSVVLDMETSPSEEYKVSAYISCRQIEIIRELNEYVNEYLS